MSIHRWYSQLRHRRADGVTLYYVKALQKEQMMSQTDLANCSGLTIAPYDLPPLSEFVDPDIGTEPATSGPRKSSAAWFSNLFK